MQRRYRRAHRILWFFLAVLIPAVLAVALWQKPSGQHEQPAVALDETAQTIGEE
ncbi:hypothetical protein [Flexibacterium corallicola]|uniref:hypothetical protein n=1 Tax=Flexibacterium corallicola TaxID=3037259 RepID=UPI00286F3690|nr:hypothetical protein [Pseudovibrio sp. M1P-2-3]